MKEKALEFLATLENLHGMLCFISEETISSGFSEEMGLKIELAIEEALVNIIKHGYSEQAGMIEISCMQTSPPGIKFTLRDQGIPYNPLTNIPSINPQMQLEARAVGGYGIYLIFKIMDEISYRREDDCNILTLIKYKQ